MDKAIFRGKELERFFTIANQHKYPNADHAWCIFIIPFWNKELTEDQYDTLCDQYDLLYPDPLEDDPDLVGAHVLLWLALSL